METGKRTQLLVGIFLLFGLVTVMASIFMLGADRALFKKYARLHAHFDQVQGLAKGSVISLSGVVVGNVEDIEFMNETKSLNVIMKVEDQFLERIPRDSQVEIRTQGALGDKYVFIIPGTLGEKSASDGDQLRVSAPTDILGIFSERGKDTEKIFDIIHEVHKTLKAVNSENRIEKIMAHLTTISSNLNSTSEQTRKLSASFADGSPGEKLSRSLDKFENIMNKIDKGQGSLGALINDPTIHDRLKALLGSSSRKTDVKDLLRTSIEKASD